MRRGASFLLLAFLAPFSTAPAFGQTCEGSARSATTETRHFDCSRPEGALKWNLNIACLDACDQVWFTLAPQPGQVDGSCGNGVFCTPPYYYKDHNNGLYAETSAFSTQYHHSDGCINLDQVVSSGDCPCAPSCGGGGEEPTTDDKGTTDSPIVLDLDRGGFRFTDLAGGVRFDLDGDGAAERVSWIAPGSGDGWLALDRDGDGAIRSGTELFGNFTPQPPSAEPHGFAAFAVYDQPSSGGDGDGAITAGDAVFGALRLWVDADHDGVSQPGELIPLAAAGIRSIDLGYVTSAHRDEHGNELRYASRVGLATATTLCADVFLLSDD